jgi:hypothetical protein
MLNRRDVLQKCIARRQNDFGDRNLRREHSGTTLNQPRVIWSIDVSPDGKQAAVVYSSVERFLKINHLIIVEPG